MLLDTDVLIDILRDHPPAVAWFESLENAPIASGIAAMELIAGCRNKQELQATKAFLRLFAIGWPSHDDLEVALGKLLPLKIKTGIGLLDAITAATAIGLNLELATYNVKHYADISELLLVQPYLRDPS